MRVMFLGDTHASLPFMLSAINASIHHRAKTIIQVGDFSVWDHIPAGVEFLDVTNAQLERKDTWLIFVDGNHENFESLYDYPLDEGGFRVVRNRILHAPRGLVWSMGGLNFLAFGGASSIDGPNGPDWWPQARGIGNGWWPQEQITQADVHHALNTIEATPSIDVMVSHDCPAGVAIPGIRRTYPDAEMTRNAVHEIMWRAQPQLLVCGHYHRRHTDMLNQTRIEILSSNEQKNGQAIFLETDPFTLIA